MKEKRKTAGGKDGNAKRGRGAIAAVRAFSAIVGTVVGAGFVSGRELLRFFGTFRLPAIFFAAVLFGGCFLLFMRLGARYGGYAGVVRALFGRFTRCAETAFSLGLLLSCVAMLSGVNALFPRVAPFVASVFLAIACLSCEKGIGGVSAVNLLLTPLILATAALLIVRVRAISPPDFARTEVAAFFSVFLYASMNVFLSAPVLCDLGASFSRRSASAVSLFSSLTIGGAIALILSAVCSDKSSFSADMPLSYIFGNGTAGAGAFRFLAAGGMFTTLVSALYPLYRLVQDGKDSGRGETKYILIRKLCLASVLFALSFVPFGKIVSRVYPALGAAGGGFVLIASAHLFRLSRRKKRGEKKLFERKKKDFYCRERRDVI